MTEIPADGDSIWIVLEDGGEHRVEYAVVFYDHDGPVVRCEWFADPREQYVVWPPPHVIAWRTCEVPEFKEGDAGQLVNRVKAIEMIFYVHGWLNQCESSMDVEAMCELDRLIDLATTIRREAYGEKPAKEGVEQ